MASGLLIWAVTLVMLVVAAIVIAQRQKVVSQETSIQIGLPGTPNYATKSEIAFIATRAASKHVRALVGLTPTLKPDSRSRQRLKLPHIYMRGVLNFNENDERLYNDAVGADDSDKTISALFLVSLTLPLVIHILVDRACPILPLGAVNTRNSFEVHQPQLARDIVALRKASAESGLSYRVYFGGHDRPGYRRKRGMEFCISITILYHGDAIITQDLRFLQFLPQSFEPRYQPEEDAKEHHRSLVYDEKHNESLQRFHLGAKDSAKWAAATKDYNPIHVSAMGAKIFGFKSIIAHGNHILALALEQLRIRNAVSQNMGSAQANRMFWEDTAPFTLEARFVRPIALPAEVRLVWQNQEKDDGDVSFGLLSRGKACIEGALRQYMASE